MNISTETREILRNYRAVINARRREMGQKPLTTAQIVDEICDFVANQQAVFLGGHYILQGTRRTHGDVNVGTACRHPYDTGNVRPFHGGTGLCRCG
uniref:Plasmid protein n=3 Tax=root TaxID=1 RepID=A0A2S0NSX2_ECOLX|nr:hypothetical protein [Escherichia coli]